MLKIFLANRDKKYQQTKLEALQIKQEVIIHEAKIKKADIKAMLAFNQQCIKEGILTPEEVEDYEAQNQEGKELFKAVSQAEREIKKSKSELSKEVEGENLLTP
jgi:histidinol phosphatase-like enzyme